MPYTDDELLDMLREYAADHGTPPTTREAEADDALPNPSTFRDHFGNWNAAIEQAGLEPHHRRRSDEELLDALREYAAEHGYPPTMVEANEAAGFPSTRTFQDRFGSWNNALERAGFEPYTPDETQYSSEELLDTLRTFRQKHGRAPTSTEADDPATDLPTRVAFQDHLGSWSDALDAAGLEPHRRLLSDAELLDALRAFADEHGYPPTVADLREDDALPSATAYRNHFGSWTDALERAGLSSQHHRSERVES